MPSKTRWTALETYFDGIANFLNAEIPLVDVETRNVKLLVKRPGQDAICHLNIVSTDATRQ